MYNTKRTYAIGLVLYHPGKRLIERADLIIKLGFCLYIFDNSPFAGTNFEVLQQSETVHYSTAGRNIGIARALSLLCATAYAHGHHRLLYLDQDTCISEQTLEFIDEYTLDARDVPEGKYAAIVFSAKKPEGRAFAVTTLAISSGSLFMLDALRRIGWHNDRYFVDCVDYEFCLRALHFGYRIGVVFGTPSFDHVSEQPDREVHLIGKRLLIRPYAFARIVDALSAYLRLLGYTVRIIRFDFSLLILRSLLIYLSGQIIARLVPRSLSE